MKAKVIAYWITTSLLAIILLSGGAAQATRQPQTVAGILALGYPSYFVTIIGLWKVLGGITLLVPRFPRLKEWAYAGVIFEMTGASASYLFSGGAEWHVLVPFVLSLLALASWALRPADRMMGKLLPARSAA